MSQEKILIVEDDKHISKLLKYNLDKAGYETFVVITGEEALKFLDGQSVDLVILDVMLPKIDGFEVCKRIKQSEFPPAVIMLTARGEEVDRIVGLEIGADDYMVKPFSPRELILRIKAILKRKVVAEPKVNLKNLYQVDQLKIDIERHKVTIADKEIILTAMEFKLLLTLVSRRGRMLSRDMLLSDVWDINSEVTTRTIDTHVKRLRQKLGKMADYIETVRGYGYRFKEEGAV